MLDSSTYYQLRFYTYLSTTALASRAPLLDIYIYIYIYITKLSPQVCWLNEFFFVNPRREYSRSSIGSVGNAAQLLNFHHSFSFPLASFHILKLLLVQEKKIEPKLKNYGHSNKCSPYIIYVSEFGCEYILPVDYQKTKVAKYILPVDFLFTKDLQVIHWMAVGYYSFWVLPQPCMWTRNLKGRCTGFHFKSLQSNAIYIQQIINMA